MATVGDGVFSRPEPGRRTRVLLAGSDTLRTPAQQALDRILRSGQATSVLQLYLSRVHPAGPQPHHRRVARCLFDDAVQAGGQVFTCSNGDLLMIAGPDTVAGLGATLLRLFRGEAPADQQLLGLWSLPDDEAAIHAAFATSAELQSSAREQAAPLGTIAAISVMLSSAPCGELIRRQVAVQIVGGRLRPLFHELSISVPALEAHIGMRLPSGADPYLSRYLAGQLDERMLGGLADAELDRIHALNVNLPLTCAGSPGLSALSGAARQAGLLLGVEIPFVEVMADLPRFTALRAAWQADGWRVLLDGIDHHMLLQCDPASLLPDLIKLEWSALIPAQPAREQRRLARALEAVGTDRVVLDRADTETALIWGIERGITRFQGRHVDAMLAADRLRMCEHAAGCSLRQCIDRAAATDADGQIGCRDTGLLAGVLHRSPVAS